MKFSRACFGLIAFIAAALPAFAALPEVWQVRSSPASNDLTAIAYGNGLFVAVGRQTTILVSSNGTHWAQPSAGATDDLYSAAHGNGRFAAGGQQSHLLQSSTDGVNWGNRMTVTDLRSIFGLTYGNGLFVGVGLGSEEFSTYIVTSPNAATWTAQGSPTIRVLRGVARGTNVFVAVGDNGTIISSPRRHRLDVAQFDHGRGVASGNLSSIAIPCLRRFWNCACLG